MKEETLYETAVQIDSRKVFRMVREAKTEEEREFYAFIANMNLRRNQKEAIEKNLF